MCTPNLKKFLWTDFDKMTFEVENQVVYADLGIKTATILESLKNSKNRKKTPSWIYFVYFTAKFQNDPFVKFKDKIDTDAGRRTDGRTDGRPPTAIG